MKQYEIDPILEFKTKSYFKSINLTPFPIRNINHLAEKLYSINGHEFDLFVSVDLRQYKSFAIVDNAGKFAIRFFEEMKDAKNVGDSKYGLSDHQFEQFEKIYDLIMNGHHCCLDAAAGTGKTYMIKSLSKRLKSSGKNVVICSTTHKACAVIRKNMPYEKIKTIHSFLNLKLVIDYKTGEEKYVPEKGGAEIVPGTVVLVDESSMINAELFKFISESIVKVDLLYCFIGDSYQLPPVNENLSYALQLPHRHTLTEIVRQDNSIVMAGEFCRQRIDGGQGISKKSLLEFDDISIKDPMDIVADLKSGKNAMYGAWTNNSVNWMAKEIRAALGHDPLILSEGETIVTAAPVIKKKSIVIGNNTEVVVKSVSEDVIEGIRVMYVVGRSEHGNDVSFYVTMDNERLKKRLQEMAKLSKMSRDWRHYFSVKEKIVPITWPYSSTVHRAQGSTVDCVYVDYDDIIRSDIAARLLYVGITRTSNKAFLV